jgi:hypothetical protein
MSKEWIDALEGSVERASPYTPSRGGYFANGLGFVFYNENLFDTLGKYAASVSLWREN